MFNNPQPIESFKSKINRFSGKVGHSVGMDLTSVARKDSSLGKRVILMSLAGIHIKVCHKQKCTIGNPRLTRLLSFLISFSSNSLFGWWVVSMGEIALNSVLFLFESIIVHSCHWDLSQSFSKFVSNMINKFVSSLLWIKLFKLLRVENGPANYL